MAPMWARARKSDPDPASIGDADAPKRRYCLPRSLSSPLSRNWMYSRGTTAAASKCLPPAKPHNDGQLRMKTDLRKTSDMKDDEARLRRFQQGTRSKEFASDGLDFNSPPADALNLDQFVNARAAMPEQNASTLLEIGYYSEKESDRTVPLRSRKTGRLGRSLSGNSEAAMHQLCLLEDQLIQIEQNVLRLERIVRNPQKVGPDGIGKLRTDLALLEAKANKLETNGVDDIYTSELISGKDAAKDSKKEMLRRLETLFALFEELFTMLSKM